MLSRMMSAKSFPAPAPDRDAFVASMPSRYRELFDDDAIDEHAAIVARRGDASAHVELWRELSYGGVAICVVADDRTGLLSLISAALVVHELDVVAAQAYCRVARGVREAVDFFWLRRVADDRAPIGARDIEGIGEVLSALVEGSLSVDSVAKNARAIRARAPHAITRVRFESGADDALAVLKVETFDRPGLLLAISQALFRQRIQIVWSEARTRDGRVLDHFHLAEFDGGPVRKERRRRVQAEVLAAIESLARKDA